MTRTPLSRSKGQRSTCREWAYCGGLPHNLFVEIALLVILSLVSLHSSMHARVGRSGCFFVCHIVKHSLLNRCSTFGGNLLTIFKLSGQVVYVDEQYRISAI